MSDTRRLIAGPFNRVEGDLEIALDIEGGRVAAARVNAPLFRGFEAMLTGRDPRDALVIVPRICGICSVSQSAAAARALAAAQGLEPTVQGALATQLIHAAENLADHLTHFYLFFMPDFTRPAYEGQGWHARALARFGAGTGSGMRAALRARGRLLHIMGLLAGKWPHTMAIQPGGTTRAADARIRIRLIGVIRAFRRFLEAELFADRLEAVAGIDSPQALSAWAARHPDSDMALFLMASAGLEGLGRGPGRWLSCGAYPTADGPLFAAGLSDGTTVTEARLDTVTEDLSHAWMLGAPAHPYDGETRPDPEMRAPGYSWCKAPRLAGRTVEVGAFARQVVDGHPLALSLATGGGDARARVVGRLLEIARTVPAMERWAEALTPGAPFIRHGPSLKSGRGAGLVEAARGTLGHWIRVEEGRIASFQIVAPTTWNFSPRDAGGIPGPVEQALEGAPVQDGETTPLAVQHIVRSFDPCMVCTVH